MEFKLNTLIRSLVIFFVLYFGLTGLHLIPEVKEAHSMIYCTVGQAILNGLNPNVFAVIKTYKGPEEKYDITLDLYDRNKYKNLRNKRARSQAIARFTINREFFIMGQLPLIFLLSLIIATPISIRRKLIAFAIGILLFYAYISIYLSYDFEQLFKGQDFTPGSFWGYLTKAVGGFSLNEHILLVALIIWSIVCFTPNMLNKIKAN